MSSENTGKVKKTGNRQPQRKLIKNPNYRPPTKQEVADDLERQLAKDAKNRPDANTGL